MVELALLQEQEMFSLNGMSFVPIIIYLYVTTLTFIRPIHCQTGSSTVIGCMRHPARCYMVYSSPIEDYRSASEICSRQHNGNLATIYNSSTQESLLRMLRKSVVQLTSDYWIGAQLELLDNWTWLDGTTYYALNSISGLPDSSMRGYVSLRMDRDHGRYSPSWHLTTLSLADKRQQHALCECRTASCRGRHRYFNVSATRWFDGRNACLREGGDLAMLTSSHDLGESVQENVDYFVGLANVRLVWLLSTGTGKRRIANYTNFNNRSPNSEDELCVNLYPENGEWNAAKCNVRKPFICEYKNDSRIDVINTTPSTTWVESSSAFAVITTSSTNPTTVSSTTTTTTRLTNRPMASSKPIITTTTTTTTSLKTTTSSHLPAPAVPDTDVKLTTIEPTSDFNSQVSGSDIPTSQTAVTVAVVVLSLVLFLLIAVTLIALCCVRRKRLKGQSDEADQPNSVNHYQQQQLMSTIGQSSASSAAAADEVQYATIVRADVSRQSVSNERQNGKPSGKAATKEDVQYTEVVNQRRPPPMESKPRVASDNRASSSSTSASKTASQSQASGNNKDTATDSNTVYACILPTSCPVDSSTNDHQAVIYAGLL